MNCPRCNSTHVVKAGFKVTVSRGRVQMYKCMGCGHVFSEGKQNA
jgi:transposase-like protein